MSFRYAPYHGVKCASMEFDFDPQIGAASTPDVTMIGSDAASGARGTWDTGRAAPFRSTRINEMEATLLAWHRSNEASHRGAAPLSLRFVLIEVNARAAQTWKDSLGSFLFRFLNERQRSR